MNAANFVNASRGKLCAAVVHRMDVGEKAA
jgi:hypothetical protein